MSRRLPVYVLLDCSESMAGPGIEGLRTAVGSMLRELRSNPHALDTVWMSFIAIDHEARQLASLRPLVDVELPNLKIRPGTAMGAALQLTADSIRREVRRTTPGQKGDYRPLVFIITDGQPTDDWQDAALALQQADMSRPANVYAIGCGSDVDYQQLGKITDIVLRIEKVGPEGFARLFMWLSASVGAASVGAQDSSEADLLASLPRDVQRIDLSKAPRHDGKVRQIFMRAHCLRKRGAYLMRFRLVEGQECYAPVASHVLDNVDGTEGSSFRLPPVSSSALLGCPPCPLCQNEAAGRCANCGNNFCLPLADTPQSIECPCCQSFLELRSSDGSFDVGQSAG